MAKKDKSKDKEILEPPVDLAARVGGRGAPKTPAPPPPAAPPPAMPETTPENRADRPLPPRRLAAPPGPGETDLVVTPLPTLDDWHRFELALRKLGGVGQVRTEYYRHGVLKVRVAYAGPGRLAQALRTTGVSGYRVRIIGEDRRTVQITVSSDNDERRPG